VNKLLEMNSMLRVRAFAGLNTGRTFSTEKAGLKTKLYDLHVKLGGKMVPYAGYQLPVLYDGLGVLKEHTHTRAKGCASLFDVSHMGQIQ